MRFQISALACALLSFTVLNSRAERWESKELNFSINLPLEQGWTQLGTPREMVKVAARSADRKYVVSIVVAPADTTMLAEQFIARFKKQWFKHGTSRKTSDTLVQVDGQSASCIKDITVLEGKAMYRADTVFVNGGYFYEIATLGSDSDPLMDTTVKALVASFHFLNKASAFSPTSVSKRAATLRPLPVTRVTSNATDKIPQLIADLTVAVMVLILIAWAVSKAIRDRKATGVRPPPISAARHS
ncbi:MAG: hypothetical protein ACXWJB_08430 [Limisphaerales bacterium]